jgi:hypothetical protein
MPPMSIAMSIHRSRRSCVVLAGLVLPLALLTGCPADDTPADTEATGTGTTGTSTDGGPGPDPDTTAASESTSSTTAVADETTTSVPGDTDTTGEPPPAGTCAGLDAVGHVATVYSRDGMPIDTTCDAAPAPCGGDPVGIWAIESSCGFEALPNPLEAMCPGSTVSLEILSLAGTIAFEADGSYVQDLDIESQVILTLNPVACFGVSCAILEASLQMDNPAATCQAMGPDCACTFPDNGQPEQAMGTWVLVGNEIVITTRDGAVSIPFCIDGDRLDQWQPLYDLPVSTEVVCADDQDCVEALGDMYDLYICEHDEEPGG